MGARPVTSSDRRQVSFSALRLASLLQGWGPIAMLLVLAAGSAWLLNQVGGQASGKRQMVGYTPDFYMDDFEITTMDEQGRPWRRLSAAHMAHFPTTSTKEFTEPRLVIYRVQGTPWHVASERGWISADDEVLLLLGKVDIWRNNLAGEREIHIETRDLKVLPESQFGETEMPVVITTAQARTQGKGMRAYLDQSRLELLSEVRTTIEPPARRN